MNKIPTICYEDIYEFCEDVDHEFKKYLDKAIKNNSTIDIAIVVKYKNAREIINVLVDFGYEIANVSIHDSIMSGYSDEYIVSLCYGLNHSDVPEIWCEPAKNDKGYLLTEGQAVYILDECNKDMIPKVLGDKTFIVEIDSDDEEDLDDEFSDDLELGAYHCNEDCENCHEYDKDDDDYVTIKLDKSDVEILHKLYNIFGI